MAIKLSEVLRETHERFAAASLIYGQGTDNAWDEAVALVLGASGLPDRQSSLDAPLPGSQTNRIRELARRRVVERQPLAYLLGKASYCGERFLVPPGIVVPRSPIGPLLVKGGLRPWLPDPRHILDLCCGSGCLGILAARHFPSARVVLADIDRLAVETARRNLVEHGLEGRVEAVWSDLFSGLDTIARRAIEKPPKPVRGTDHRGGSVALVRPDLAAESEPPQGVENAARAAAAGTRGRGEVVQTRKHRRYGSNADAAGTGSQDEVVQFKQRLLRDGELVAAGTGGRGEAVQSPESKGIGPTGSRIDDSRFDLILCNPPYVDADAMAALPPEFAREPALGLAGGVDGLTPMNRVIGAVSNYLAEDGVFVGEVGEGRGRLEDRWRCPSFVWPDLPDGGEGVFLLLAADARRLNQ